MSIASEITRLQNIKSDIRTALVNKGISGAASHDMANFAVDISNIQNGGANLTITYSEEFYGVTLSASNGVKTVTKVAPSTGSTEIVLPESGTWVVSATISGQTYSTTVTVDLEYTATLEAIPDGSTVTPTDDIQTWLKCAGITDKTTYTTLSDVLGDTETLIALCADSNACDYMARSTNWASGVAADSTAMLIVGKYNYCANKLISNATWAEALAGSSYWQYVFDITVPTMTSNTTPSGVASASHEYGSNYAAWKAFDGNNSTGWAGNNVATTEWVQYKFPSPVVINAIAFSTAWGTNIQLGDFKIQGSNDNGTTWTDIYSGTVENSQSLASVILYRGFENTTAYSIYRMNMLNSHDGSLFTLYTLQFYGRTDNANYIPLVPVMTSNTTPSGVCSASAEYDSSTMAYKAFDGNDSDGWAPNSTSNQWIQYEFTSAKAFNRVSIKPLYSGGSTRVKNFKIQGSNDGSTFTDIYTGIYTDSTSAVSVETFTFENTTAYKYARLLVIDTYGGNIYVTRLQFYAIPTLPIIHSAVEDSIFYMDDGSPVALCGIPVGDTIDVDLEAYKGQTLTLVSTVAKDPTNLSNDFSMNVRITPNITEIYLMPVGALYWWGYESPNFEVCSTANGWANVSGYSYVTPTKNTHDYTLVSGSGNKASAIGTKNAINGTSLKTIAQGLISSYGNVGYANSKTHGLVGYTGISSTNLALYSQSFSGSVYGLVVSSNGASSKVNALWYE